MVRRPRLARIEVRALSFQARPFACRMCGETFLRPHGSAREYCERCRSTAKASQVKKERHLSPAEVDALLTQASLREWRLLPPWVRHPQSWD